MSFTIIITRPCSEGERLASACWLSSCPRNTRQHFASLTFTLGHLPQTVHSTHFPDLAANTYDIRDSKIKSLRNA
jgi:hypothetical protein